MDVQENGSRVRWWWHGQAAGACVRVACVLCVCVGHIEKAKQVSEPEKPLL